MYGYSITILTGGAPDAYDYAHTERLGVLGTNPRTETESEKALVTAWAEDPEAAKRRCEYLADYQVGRYRSGLFPACVLDAEPGYVGKGEG